MSNPVLTSTQPAGQSVRLLLESRQVFEAQLAAASSANFSAPYIYWDAGTTVPLAQQDGSAAAPFKVLQTAINAAAVSTVKNGTVYCVGEGNAAEAFTFDGSGVNAPLTLIALNGMNQRAPCAVGDFTLQNHCHVVMNGIKGGVATVQNSRLWAAWCSFGSIQATASNVRLGVPQASTDGDASTPFSIGNTHITSSTFHAFGMRIAGNLVLDGPSTDNIVQDCQFQSGGLSLFMDAGSSLFLDGYSLATASLNSYNLKTNVNAAAVLTFIETPTFRSVAFPIPAFAGAGVQYIRVACPGCLAGDAFVCTWITGGLALPAQISLGAGAYTDIGDNGFVKVPVIATAAFAGGTSWDLQITRLPVGRG